MHGPARARPLVRRRPCSCCARPANLELPAVPLQASAPRGGAPNRVYQPGPLVLRVSDLEGQIHAFGSRRGCPPTACPFPALAQTHTAGSSPYAQMHTIDRARGIFKPNSKKTERIVQSIILYGGQQQDAADLVWLARDAWARIKYKVKKIIDDLERKIKGGQDRLAGAREKFMELLVEAIGPDGCGFDEEEVRRPRSSRRRR